MVKLMERLVDQCISIGDMVSPVVCNSSPEGYLPHQNNDVQKDASGKEEKLQTTSKVHVYV